MVALRRETERERQPGEVITLQHPKQPTARQTQDFSQHNVLSKSQIGFTPQHQTTLPGQKKSRHLALTTKIG